MTYKWSAQLLNFATNDELETTIVDDNVSKMAAPIGSVMPWLKSLGGVTPALPGTWVECNGQTLSDSLSPLDGQVIPDLNGSGGAGNRRWLRGGSTSGTTGGSITGTTLGQSSTYSSSWNPVGWGKEHDHSTIADVRPPFYSVVFIMRVR